MARIAIALAIVLSLPACARIDAYESAAEPYVDQALERQVSRLCKLPVDIINRNLDTDQRLEAALLICADLNQLVTRGSAIISARKALQLPEPKFPAPEADAE